MQNIPDVPITGSFISNQTPVMILAYANSNWIVGPSGSSSSEILFSSEPGWFILTKLGYELASGQSSAPRNVEELIFTPYYSGKYNFKSSGQGEALISYRQVSGGNSCSDSSMGPNAMFPVFDYNNPTAGISLSNDFYLIANENELADANISPAIVKLVSTSDGHYKIVDNDTNKEAVCLHGTRLSASPYDAITITDYSGPKDVDTINKFIIYGLFDNDNKVMVDGNLLYAGYPYKIAHPQAYIEKSVDPKEQPVSPFRNLLQLKECIGDTADTPSRYINYVDLHVLHHDRVWLNTLGPNYTEDRGNINYAAGSVNAPFSFNWANLDILYDGSNYKNTVQFYFIPVQYYKSAGGTACNSIGSGDPQQAWDNIITPIYFQRPFTCTPTLTDGCFFASLENCQLGFWQNYCISPDTSCGPCFGQCTSENPIEQFCRIAGDPKPTKPFTCGSNPAPEPPPAPPAPTPQDLWERYKDWIYGVIIFLAIFVLFAIMIAFGIASKKN